MFKNLIKLNFDLTQKFRFISKRCLMRFSFANQIKTQPQVKTSNSKKKKKI